jgi:hypothetical protein
MYEYVDDEFAVYVPANAQGLPFVLHSAELGVLTQRSLLPVSRCNRTLCAGVPNVPLAKYNVSYFQSALTIKLTFHYLPHCSMMLGQWLISSVIDLSIPSLEQTFFELEILLPGVVHRFFFVVGLPPYMLIINSPRGQNSRDPS